MMSAVKIQLSVIVTLLLAASVGASPLFSLSEFRALELAFSRGRELSMLENRTQIVTARSTSIDWLENPEIRFSEISSRYVTDEFDELEIGMRWRPPNLAIWNVDEQENRVAVTEAEVDMNNCRRQLAARVRKVFSDVVMLDELTRLFEKRVIVQEKRIGVIEQMVRNGQRSIIYATKARMAVNETKNDFTRVRQDRSEKRRRLAELTGCSENVLLEIDELPEIDSSFPQLRKIALSRRPEIELVNQKKSLAQKQYNYERLKLVPWFRFFEASHHVRENGDGDWDELMIGVAIPLFNWNIGNIRATNIAVERRETQTEAIRERIEAQVGDTYAIYRDTLLDYQNFSDDAKQFLFEAERIIKISLSHRTLNPDEVMELELAILGTKRLLVEKRGRLAHALAEVYLVVGVNSVDELK